MFEHVRLICFDLDDTLWPCRPVIMAAEAACYAWLQGEAPALTQRYTIEELREHRIRTGEHHPELAHDMTAIRQRSLAELLQQNGYHAAVADAASEVFRAARNRVTPFDEVRSSLARLRTRFTLVSVTNGNAQVECTPLRDSFDLSLTAAEVGAAKPHPAMFHAASRRTGIPLAACLHVGDDPLRDVAAARDLGLATVWVNRDGRSWPTERPQADLQVRDLAELERVLMVPG